MKTRLFTLFNLLVILALPLTVSVLPANPRGEFAHPLPYRLLIHRLTPPPPSTLAQHSSTLFLG